MQFQVFQKIVSMTLSELKNRTYSGSSLYQYSNLLCPLLERKLSLGKIKILGWTKLRNHKSL